MRLNDEEMRGGRTVQPRPERRPPEGATTGRCAVVMSIYYHVADGIVKGGCG